jgi:IS30 family transposase
VQHFRFFDRCWEVAVGQLGRPGLSAVGKAEMWERWKAGESISDIARALEKGPGSIFGTLRDNGGIAPARRTRSPRCLSAGDREEISRGLAVGESLRCIASRLGRAPSTISREVARNGGRGKYRAGAADDHTWNRARRPKLCLLTRNPRVRRLVAGKLRQDWSPQQIAGWLRRSWPHDDTMWVSHETIYVSLYVQARGALRKELQRHLRTQRVMRRARTAGNKGQGRGQITDAVPISQRPAEVEDRAVPGHWEGDLIAGSGNSHVATLVERHSRYLMLVKVNGKDAQTVNRALKRRIRRLPDELAQSLTWDRGMELAKHQDFTVASGVQVFFCDPQSPWQRGTNENTNGLLRQYLPKGTDLSKHSQVQLNGIARRLNTRPRKTLDYATPAATLAAALH